MPRHKSAICQTLLWGCCTFIGVVVAAGQTATTPLSNQDVLALKAAGLGDDLIILKIRSSPGNYQLDVADIVKLKESNLSETVIAAMIEASKKSSSSHEATPSSTDGATARVYFYRYKQYIGGMLEPSVYCDEVELARMDNGRYFIANLEAGKHTFRSNDRQSGFEANLEGGKNYYVRVEIATGLMKGHGRLVLANVDQGGFEIKRLKPLDAPKIRDHSRVISEYGKEK